MKVLETYSPPLIKYSINWDNGGVSETLILQKCMQDGASLPTYLCQDEFGKRFITGTDSQDIYGYDSVLEALTAILRQLNESRCSIEKVMIDMQNELDEAKARIERTKQAILDEVKKIEQKYKV